MMHISSFRAALVLTLILFLDTGPGLLSAQQVPSEVPAITIRANTRLVMVDLVVTDKKGQPIPGLKAEDFTVEENGKREKISVFVPPTAANTAELSPVPPGILSNRRENVSPTAPPTVLVLDALNSPFKEQAYGRLQMLKYVEEQSQAGHPMAVLALTDRLHVLQQFTSDPQVLLTAIKNFRPQEPILQPSPPPPGSSVPADMGGPPMAITELIAVTRSELASFANMQIGYEIERRTLITVEAMRSLARMLGGLDGRKSVLWLTADLPFDLIPEDRNVSDAELATALPVNGSQPVSVRAAGALAAEQRQLHGQEIKDAESRLASANVAIYPIDLRGLVSGMEGLAGYSGAHSGDIHGAGLANIALRQSGSLIGSQDTMREVAAETGGKAYMNQNEIRQSVALALADDKASYSIGYYPANKKWDGKFRNIKVKLNRGDSEVRCRRGYFAFDPTLDKNWKPEQDVAAALQMNLPATQVAFMAQAKPTDPGKIRVLFLVDAHTLSAEDSSGNKKMNVALYASLFDATGKNLGTRSLRVDRTFDAATYQQILNKGMMVPLEMEVPAGAKELRLAVLDNKTGFIGTVSGPLGP